MLKGLTLCAGVCLFASTGFAQDTTGRPRVNVRGDQSTTIRTTEARNVPRGQRSPGPQSRFRPDDPLYGDPTPDVLLDIPNVSVDELTIEVNNLQANLSLDARVANLVQLKAGVDASIERVNITIKGVQASALLIVRLDNVRAIIEKTLTTLDNNPQLVERLLQSVDNTVNTVGDVANTALQPNGLLSQTVNTLGQTVNRTLDATGNIVEKTLDNTGKLLSSRTLGTVLNLPVISQTTNAAGQTVKRVRDEAGGVIEVVVDAAGKLVSSKVISGATGDGNNNGGNNREGRRR